MDMDKYFIELDKLKENNAGVNNNAPSHCPMCARRCELVAPLCNRGVNFARQNNSETQTQIYYS